MGYSFLANISEACKKKFKTNLAEVAQMGGQGLMSSNLRVRYEAMQSLGFLLNEQSPHFQKKYHADLVPIFVKLMTEETHLKMQTQAAACMTSFIRGLIDEESAEDSEINQANKAVLLPYAEDIVQSISTLF
jgi:hypothetical protein